MPAPVVRDDTVTEVCTGGWAGVFAGDFPELLLLPHAAARVSAAMAKAVFTRIFAYTVRLACRFGTAGSDVPARVVLLT
jgi:hypothetical protein